MRPIEPAAIGEDAQLVALVAGQVNATATSHTGMRSNINW
jgi:hypothetical protein